MHRDRRTVAGGRVHREAAAQPGHSLLEPFETKALGHVRLVKPVTLVRHHDGEAVPGRNGHFLADAPCMAKGVVKRLLDEPVKSDLLGLTKFRKIVGAVKLDTRSRSAFMR